jgi:hypothetical protein
MLEMLDAKLELMNGKPVILVRPLFGTQSDSFVGDLLLYDTTTYPVKFQVAANGMATIFTSDDIKSTRLLEVKNPSVTCPRLVITLKGQKDYV